MVSDFNELKSCYNVNSYKAVLLLAGSILESCLIDNLKQDESKNLALFNMIFQKKVNRINNVKKIEDMTLYELIEVSFQAEPFKKSVGNLLKDFRNIIHPDVQIRKKMKYQPNTHDAKLVVEALLNVLKLFSS